MCQNNPEKSSATKIGKHIPCVYSISEISAFGNIKNKHNLYCGEDCMKFFFESLKKTGKKYNLLRKEKNVTDNKKGTKVI